MKYLPQLQAAGIQSAYGLETCPRTVLRGICGDVLLDDLLAPTPRPCKKARQDIPQILPGPEVPCKGCPGRRPSSNPVRRAREKAGGRLGPACPSGGDTRPSRCHVSPCSQWRVIRVSCQTETQRSRLCVGTGTGTK